MTTCCDRATTDLIAEAVESPEFVAAFLNALAEKVYADNVKAGWWHDLRTGESILHSRNVPEMLMLIVSEVVEAMEGHCKGLSDDKLPNRPALQVELVDALIRILDLFGSRMAIERSRQQAQQFKHGLGDIFEEKRAYNDSRPDHQLHARRAEGGKSF